MARLFHQARLNCFQASDPAAKIVHVAACVARPDAAALHRLDSAGAPASVGAGDITARQLPDMFDVQQRRNVGQLRGEETPPISSPRRDELIDRVLRDGVRLRV